MAILRRETVLCTLRVGELFIGVKKGSLGVELAELNGIWRKLGVEERLAGEDGCRSDGVNRVASCRNGCTFLLCVAYAVLSAAGSTSSIYIHCLAVWVMCYDADK